MTLKDAEKKFGLPYDVLDRYVSFGFIRKSTAAGEYRDEDFERLGLIDTLLSAGFTPEETKKYLSLTENKGTDNQQIMMLKKQRRLLLDDIHDRQRALDRLDYMIWMKKGRTKSKNYQ